MLNTILMMSCVSNKEIVAKVDRIKISYKGKEVNARKLTISSHIPVELDLAWEKVQTSSLLEFVAEGKVTFKPTEGHFPERWREGDTVTTKMLLYGLLPFGAAHYLKFERIDQDQKILQTREWDKAAKVWDHKISMKPHSDKTTFYEDEVIIYGGILTAFITNWAKSFYKHRQKRWQVLALQKP